jgi:hypothetical protein
MTVCSLRRVLKDVPCRTILPGGYQSNWRKRGLEGQGAKQLALFRASWCDMSFKFAFWSSRQLSCLRPPYPCVQLFLKALPELAKGEALSKTGSLKITFTERRAWSMLAHQFFRRPQGRPPTYTADGRSRRGPLESIRIDLRRSTTSSRRCQGFRSSRTFLGQGLIFADLFPG